MAPRGWNPARHPRDKHGRFTRSATKVMTGAEKNRAAKAIDGFTPRKVKNRQEGRAYLGGIGGSNHPPAVRSYLDGDWKQVNAALRAGKDSDGVAEIDAAMRPLPDDVVLRRQIPADVFGQVPLGDLPGLKLRDAAYASTSLDSPGLRSKPGVVTMHIAAPAGTSALVNPDDGEILLARDTEVAISRVVQNKQGGWDVYGSVLPKPKKRTKAPPEAPPAADTEPTHPGADGDSKGMPGAPVPSGRQGSPVAADDQIPAVIGGIIARDGGEPGDLVSLARVRDELPDLDRGDVDAALLRLDRARIIQLEPDSNRRALSDRAKAAAIPLGGEYMHLVSLVQPVAADHR